MAKCEDGYTPLWCNCHSPWHACGDRNAFKPDDSNLCAVHRVQGKGAMMRALCSKQISTYDSKVCSGDPKCKASVQCAGSHEVPIKCESVTSSKTAGAQLLQGDNGLGCSALAIPGSKDKVFARITCVKWEGEMYSVKTQKGSGMLAAVCGAGYEAVTCSCASASSGGYAEVCAFACVCGEGVRRGVWMVLVFLPNTVGAVLVPSCRAHNLYSPPAHRHPDLTPPHTYRLSWYRYFRTHESSWRLQHHRVQHQHLDGFVSTETGRTGIGCGSMRGMCLGSLVVP